jgi:hypothetical protein
VIVSLAHKLFFSIMKIFLAAIIILLGVNLGIDLLDSNMAELMKERNETIQKQLDQL